MISPLSIIGIQTSHINVSCVLIGFDTDNEIELISTFLIELKAVQETR